MWSLGWQETMVIFLLALLLFGPKKLPELGKNIAKGLAEFRRHSSDLKSTFDREMANIERETNPIKETAQEINNSTYDYSYYENSYYENTDSGSTGSTSASQDSTVSASATQGAESTTAAASGEASDGTQPVSASAGGSGVGEAPVQMASSEASPAETITVDKPVARS